MLLAADELMAARYQMAFSLGFHIVLSCFGVALPALIYVLHRRGLEHDDRTRCCSRRSGPRCRRCCSPSAPCRAPC